MSDGAATELLDWQGHELGVTAKVDRGYYRCFYSAGTWTASFDPFRGLVRGIDTGPLLACLHACQEDADAAKGGK